MSLLSTARRLSAFLALPLTLLAAPGLHAIEVTSTKDNANTGGTGGGIGCSASESDPAPSVPLVDVHFRNKEVYMAEGVASKLGEYNALIVDQPEVHLDPDSKYQDIEPDALARLVDDFQAAFTGELEKVYEITDEPGPDVLRVKWALTNLQLKYKWSKNPLSYTPVGAATHEIRKARSDDVTKKAALRGVMLEIELLDSHTGERLSAAVESRHRKDEPTSWQELEDLVRTYGRLLKCRLDNARVPREQWIDCVETLAEEPNQHFLTFP